MDNLTVKPKRSPALFVVQILVGLFYGAILLGGIAIPLLSYWYVGTASTIYLDLAKIGVLIYVLAAVGMIIMYRSLRSINDAAAKLWTLVAIGVAPFSAYVYLAAAAFYLSKVREELFSITNILIYGFGFYLPLILLAIWVRYHYRQDEF